MAQVLGLQCPTLRAGHNTTAWQTYDQVWMTEQ
jgi:hypothetical protein